jgi:hypothetical protein
MVMKWIKELFGPQFLIFVIIIAMVLAGLQMQAKQAEQQKHMDLLDQKIQQARDNEQSYKNARIPRWFDEIDENRAMNAEYMKEFNKKFVRENERRVATPR